MRMLRSCALSLVSRLIDDYVLRTENFSMCCDSALTRVSVGGPGSGIDNAGMSTVG